MFWASFVTSWHVFGAAPATRVMDVTATSAEKKTFIAVCDAVAPLDPAWFVNVVTAIPSAPEASVCGATDCVRHDAGVVPTDGVAHTCLLAATPTDVTANARTAPTHMVRTPTPNRTLRTPMRCLLFPRTQQIR